MRLGKNNLSPFLRALAGEATLLAPAQAEGSSKFTVYSPDMEIDLTLVNTVLPPKDALFPQTENMYRYRENAHGVTVEQTGKASKQIIFGIRPCDVQSLLCLDDVFLTQGFRDEFYARKRGQTVLIAVACSQAAPTCFCSSMGLNPAQAPGADILLTPSSHGWNVEAQTAPGQELLSRLDMLEQGQDAPLPAASCQIQADLSGIPTKLARMFEHPLWDTLHQGCLGCAVCTYLCPTCYCFEIGNQPEDDGGTAFRCWDSCMFAEYTRMAGGHNPRPGKKERLRNRYLHKLCYFHERYGKHLCVGCGRCLSKCPAGLDIVSVIEQVGRAEL